MKTLKPRKTRSEQYPLIKLHKNADGLGLWHPKPSAIIRGKIMSCFAATISRLQSHIITIFYACQAVFCKFFLKFLKIFENLPQKLKYILQIIFKFVDFVFSFLLFSLKKCCFLEAEKARFLRFRHSNRINWFYPFWCAICWLFGKKFFWGAKKNLPLWANFLRIWAKAPSI